ncbi:DUF5682 family protein [Planotetraspora sp. A-T 1434]|uniref:DUF5682 family protein n=1 Tax=Planotetraspora sp. A-T 1434 TaxID=2979219 RepID=UPI0021C237BB|nr:DUF5682 family protein [Planotetraspora sp. A-T 1434]MCT9929361.1 DUF5682 family protein [Planotetraspora sp. A-T 1434]
MRADAVTPKGQATVQAATRTTVQTAILGVRHHGPGSARAVRAELERLKPDVVLIEGPPEADALVALAADPGMEPPVALLAHAQGKAAFWPFAVFSPEWQAITYALRAGIEVRFCDLPAAHSLAMEIEAETANAGRDPIGELAEAAGYDDPERWWEDVVEHQAPRRPATGHEAPEHEVSEHEASEHEAGGRGVGGHGVGSGVLQVVAEAMAAVRVGYVPDGTEARREAHMRKTLRTAMKDGFETIAVVCGAWHVPALTTLPPAAEDERLLRGMPKVKADMTWVPWTHGRLSARSGYGAGITSPGWYDHLFAAPDRPIERWLTSAAAVLREEGLPVSSAHVIESVRLAEGLAALRGRPLAGLSEVTEAARAVLCEGDDLPVELIQRRMVVGERLGHVPDSTPMVPLQRHLREEQRRLRLKPEALSREHDLDLRKPLDLDRSRLLHRLGLIGVPWGARRETRGKGTFKESWTLEWRPEFDVALIEAAHWGITVDAAATGRAREWAAGPDVSLADLTSLVERCLLAGLSEALPDVLQAIKDRAALDSQVTHLMAALPALVRAQRYGDVRGTGGLGAITGSLLARICAGLAPALTGLDDDSAREMVALIDGVHIAAGLLEGDLWLATLTGVPGRTGVPGLIEGRVVRILFDADIVDDVATRMARSMSLGNPPARAASWMEGFLSGGGLLLVHDSRLLATVDDWLTGLSPDAFVDVLPLLRRTFGAFPPPERRMIGDRVRSGTAAAAPEVDDYDDEQAAAAVHTVLEILGLEDSGRA